MFFPNIRPVIIARRNHIGNELNIIARYETINRDVVMGPSRYINWRLSDITERMAVAPPIIITYRINHNLFL